jgi:acyl-CoA synthetase (AMP-forming)/AMP-acid ligase II
MPSSIAEAFHRLAREDPDRPAVHDPGAGRTLARRQLAADARTIGDALAGGGLPPRPCLVARVGNRPSLLALLLAALDADAAVLLLDGDGGLEQALATGARFGADAAVVPADTVANGVVSHHPLPSGLALVPVGPRASTDWRRDTPDRPVLLKMTSGSTGRARAVIAHESHLVHDAAHIAQAMNIGPADVNLAAIPLAHSYGLGNLVLPLFLQGCAIVLRERFSPREIAADVDRYGVTTFPGVPYLFEHLRRYGLAPAVASVRLLITAGAPIAPDTVQYFKQAIGRKIHSFYGTSETGGISFDDSDEVMTPISIGRPLPRTSVELRDRSAAGEEGRVFVRGPAVAAGYADPEADEDDTAFTDGGFLTADLGRFTADGRLVLAGRVSRFINVAGRKVDPAEVEVVLRSIPGVADATVVGLPCENRGEQVVAHVRAGAATLTEADVRQYCAARLSPHKVPRHVVFGHDLPADARGKIDRFGLERLIAGRADEPADVSPENAGS